MNDASTNDFFTAKHARLTRIAWYANIFAWLLFVIYILLAGAKFIQDQTLYTTFGITVGQSSDFMGALRENPLFAASYVVSWVSMFVQGVAYGLVLKGISVGLYMIVETDLNYREKSQASNLARRQE